MASRLCTILAIILFVTAVLLPLLEGALVRTIIESPRPEPWKNSYLAQTIIFRIVISLGSCCVAGAFLYIAHCIRQGGTVSVWFGAVLSALFGSCNALIVSLALISVLSGDSGYLSYFVSSSILMGFYGAILYFTIRIILVRENASATQGGTLAGGLRDVIRHLDLQLVSFICSLFLLLANLAYLIVVIVNLTSFQPGQVPVPPAPAVAVYPELPKKLPVYIARNAYVDDVFDPADGMNYSDRQSVISAVQSRSKVSLSEEVIHNLDDLLRHGGRRVIGDFYASSDQIRVFPGREYLVVEFPRGRLTLDLDHHHVTSIKGQNFSGEIRETAWRHDGMWWSCWYIERRMERIKACFPEATPVQLGAVCRMLQTHEFRLIWPGAVDAPVDRAADNSLTLKISDHEFSAKYRITPQGEVFDESTAVAAAFEKSLQSVRDEITTIQQRYNAAMAAHNSARDLAIAQKRAARVLRPMLFVLVLDGLVGIFLAVRLLRWGIAGEHHGASDRVVKPVAVVSAGLMLAIGIYIACVQDSLQYLPAGRLQLGFAVIFVIGVWRVLQSWLPFGLAALKKAGAGAGAGIIK